MNVKYPDSVVRDSEEPSPRHAAAHPPRRLAAAGLSAVGVALAAAAAFGFGGTTAVRADTTSTKGAAADAYGAAASVSLLGGTPIKVGPISGSAASEPGGNALSNGDVVNCNGCLSPIVPSAGVLNSSSAATLTSAANNCVNPPFPVQGNIPFFNGGITGGSACASVAGASLLGGIPGPTGTTTLLSADVIQAQSVTQNCTDAPIGHAGVVGLSIFGQKIPLDQLPVNLGPNTTLANILPPLDPLLGPINDGLKTLGIDIILNEEHYDSVGHGLTVNGVHIILSKQIGNLAAGDIIIAHSHSQATCSTGETNTGGGPNPCVAPGCTTPPVTPVVTKNDSTHTIAPGGTLQYTLSIDQKTATCGSLTIVTDTLPPGFSYVSSSGPLGTPTLGTQSGSGRQTVTFQNLVGFANLANPVVETITVAVGSSVPTGFTYFNEVDVTSNDCGTVHGSDTGVLVTSTSVQAATTSPAGNPNTAAAAAPGSDAGSGFLFGALGLLAAGGVAAVVRTRRRQV